MLTKKIFSTTSALLIALSFATYAASRNTHDTLQDVEMYATDAANHADQLNSFNQLSVQSHSTMLNAIKEDVNRMGREVASLEAERESLPKWEQQASDKAQSLLEATAANTQSAIEFLNENPTHLWTTDYRDHTEAIWRDAEQIAKTMKDYLKYAKTHGEEQHLEQTLGMGGN